MFRESKVMTSRVPYANIQSEARLSTQASVLVGEEATLHVTVWLYL